MESNFKNCIKKFFKGKSELTNKKSSYFCILIRNNETKSNSQKQNYNLNRKCKLNCIFYLPSNKQI